MNYLQKIFSIFSYRRSKTEKASLTVLRVWRFELIIIASVLLIVIFADIWIYRDMVSNEVEISSVDKVTVVTSLNKTAIIAGGTTVRERENLLDNPQFPLTGNPF
ncbi:MAG: hypothetical protein AAB795_01485 [Patescibacteria group bacterium]